MPSVVSLFEPKLYLHKAVIIFEHIEAPILTTDTSNSMLLSNLRNVPAAQLLFIACLLGAVMGIVFILIQPLFGMDALTSRHAAMYQKLGAWGATSALIMAWIAHSAVSVFYGLLSGIVILKFKRLRIVALFTLAFSWLTTIIAPPANAMIVQLVSFQQLRAEQLPALNFNLDVKFVLHLIFFAAISAALYAYTSKLDTDKKV